MHTMAVQRRHLGTKPDFPTSPPSPAPPESAVTPSSPPTRPLPGIETRGHDARSSSTARARRSGPSCGGKESRILSSEVCASF